MLASHLTVDLVHTETFAGALAATFAARSLEARGLVVRRLPIADLDAERPEQMRRSLGTFMGTLAGCFSGRDPRTTCFAPLGGYKVMTSLGYLTGALLGYDTLYVHEVGQRLIRVPAVPLDVRPEGLLRVRPLFWRARDAGVLAAQALSAEERQLVEAHPWMFDREGEGPDEMIAAGAFAELLLATEPHRRALQRRVLVERRVAGVHDPHVLGAAIDALLDELEHARRGELLYHEREFKHGTTAFHAFKTRTDGRFRLVWRAAEPDRIEIREAWIDDHDTYEREVRRGQVLADAPNLAWVELG
jgi:hypothetical protein